MQPQVFGVDVAKDQLVVGRHGQRPGTTEVGNDADNVQKWLSTLPRGSVVAMESTGKYHVLLARLAHAAGMRVLVINARDVHY